MKRCFLSLDDTDFDAVIVGGGIHGAAAFALLASQGYKLALIERQDFASGTSGNSLKILHGGLRYLQNLNFPRFRESIRCRHVFTQIAPHLLSPQRFITPLYRGYSPPLMLIRVALKINNWLGRDRNRDCAPELTLPGATLLSRDQCLAALPDISERALLGAIQWFDDVIDDTERMTLMFVKSALTQNSGAVALNYVNADSLRIHNGTVTGIRATDMVTGRKTTINTTNVIIAAGADAEALLPDDVRGKSHGTYAKGVNLVIDRKLFGECAVGLSGVAAGPIGGTPHQHSKERLYFFVPWYGKTLAGTYYKINGSAETHAQSEEADVQALLNELNRVYPQGSLTREDVCFWHTGFLETAHECKARDYPTLQDRWRVTDYTSEALSGVLSVSGVKYTTAPEVARQISNWMNNRCRPPKNSQVIPSLPSNAANVVRSDLTALIDRHSHILHRYGPDARAILEMMQSEPVLEEYLDTKSFLTAAEVLFFINDEMAVHLTDVVFQRCNLGSTGSLSEAVVKRLADFMAMHMGWSQEQKRHEVEELEKRFQLELR